MTFIGIDAQDAGLQHVCLQKTRVEDNVRHGQQIETGDSSETHISTEDTATQAQSWFPRPHGDTWWTGHSVAPSRAGPPQADTGVKAVFRQLVWNVAASAPVKNKSTRERDAATF